MKRTDPHTPSRIVPSDYEFVSVRVAESFDNYFLLQQLKVFNAHRERTKGVFSKHDHRGFCDICGAWCKDYAIFYYQPTNEYIKTGFDCAAKLDQEIDDNIFKRARTERQALEKAQAGKLKATAQLRENGALEHVLKIVPDLTTVEQSVLTKDKRVDGKIYIVADIVRFLVKNGSLSDKQWGLLALSLGFIENSAELIKKQQEEKAATPEVPEGKLTVKGLVVSVRFSDGFYGVQHRLTVKTEEGWVVHATVPSAISNVIKGDTIQFNATLTRDEKDHTVAFAKRPTKAVYINKIEEPQE